VWRRSFELKPPGEESLHDTVNRAIPFFQSEMLPMLRQGKKLLVVAHGNRLRAMIMHIEGLSPDAIEKVELRTGELRLYSLTASGAYVPAALPHDRGQQFGWHVAMNE
jgi:2,3-bisphosphoglycerate-dependent phosphoglycerate mutase